MTSLTPQPSSTPVEEARIQGFNERMHRFHELMEEHSDNRKADLIAYREMRSKDGIARSKVGEHPPGIQPPKAFKLRAELAICGVHHELMRGISTNAKSGVAESIVFSGYYEASEDNGDDFVYSGEGGLRNGVQVADQHWTRGNAGLRQACHSKTPIRVVRCIIDEFKIKKYYYEGLYTIIDYWTETRGDFDVCLFKFQGLDGEYSVSGTVSYNPNAFYRADEFKKSERQEPKMTSPRKQLKKHRIYGHARPIKAILEAEQERILKLKGRRNVVCLDISNGKETFSIPLINDIDEEGPPSDFRYIASLEQVSDAAEALIKESRQHWSFNGSQNKTANKHQYTNGLLQRTFPEGIREWGANGADCAKNCITSQGIRYPLEVYKTREKGWAVRSSVDIPTGAFVCEYIGRVLTDDEAEDVVDSSYLYSLDHFFLLQEQILTGAVKDLDDADVPRLPISNECIIKKEFNGKYLVFDAKHQGNIGRFINHSCPDGANLVTMMVLREGCNGVYHHIAFFASEDIPRMTELCYDYGWNSLATHKVKCCCATKNCKGYITQ